MPPITSDFTHLELETIIGFGGAVPQGLLKHSDGHMVYSLGSTVVIESSGEGKKSQDFLQGHTNTVSCLAVSKSGKFIASGQVTHMGFQADIIIWDFENRKLLHRLTLHKVKVQALAFSPNDKYLASLGGEDDNSVIVWDLAKGAAICGSPAGKDSAGVTLSLAYLNNDDNIFVTGGHSTLRVWELNLTQRKVRATDCQTGQIKRIVKCITVDSDDEFMYCGTTTGDLLQVNLRTKLFKVSGPPKEKDLFSMGVLSAALYKDDNMIVVGCGDGTIAALKLPKLNILRTVKVSGSVTSIAVYDDNSFVAGTAYSNIYHVTKKDFKATLKSTCHYSAINDICFPPNSSEVFATASDTDIRIWNAMTATELLRIAVPNLECNCITFKKDGSSLISGWNDGKIRAFGPQSGRLQYEIHDAHKRGVTALAVTDPFNQRGDFRIVSGGGDGQVRVWKVTKQIQILEDAMKEHKGTVTCIKIRKNNLECVSSSSDGSCIVWDLTRYVRNQVLFAPSFFKAVAYFPDESQLLTSGTDRKVAYWEAFDGSLIRELEASQSDTINGLDITADGRFFVIGGSDKLVKMYRYEEGDVVFVGVGHSTDITKVKISPDHRCVVSVSAEGAVFSWKFPDI
ncbi:quinon protein alcohol dehydrogenase-like superfamily [Polychytrium aggregatum]|uniref:quinon protein alcohol dehydrogenase-like superfamily n=1 Tax=Polychytrium aggregatum TaxID=110093 RepID=UPI0022FEA260|nr:quinon protein alcohol dehydrogenase-like superfamily [Polychytrium aggregatum]KAI9207349.1 quinon protein alcohol dehydrogenase-like superfamily [Polychytrium aggregatum]